MRFFPDYLSKIVLFNDFIRNIFFMVSKNSLLCFSLFSLTKPFSRFIMLSTGGVIQMAEKELLTAIKTLLSQHKRELAGETANNMHRMKQEIVMGLTQHTNNLFESNMAQIPDFSSENGQSAREMPHTRRCVEVLEQEVQSLKDLAFQIKNDLSRIQTPGEQPVRRRVGLSQVTAKKKKKVRVVPVQAASLHTPEKQMLVCSRCHTCGQSVSARPETAKKR